MSELDHAKQAAPEPAYPTREPLVFISHDTRDAELAETFSKLLSSVSAGLLKSFRSSDKQGSQGIQYGVEWYPEIMKRLAKASDVVCLLTERSIDRPWILYEAGVAKGRLETPVLGLALGIPLQRASTGPFAQFQNTDDDPRSITKLVLQLLSRIPHADPDYDVVSTQANAFKTKVDSILGAYKKKEAATSQVDVRTEGEASAKLFEEVKVMFKDLPARVEDRLAARFPMRSDIRGAHYSYVFSIADELLRSEPDEHWGLLMVIGMLREDWPGLYEIGMDVYRSYSTKRFSSARQGTSLPAQKFKRFLNLVHQTRDLAPFSSNSGQDSQLSELVHFLEYYLRTWSSLHRSRSPSTIASNATKKSDAVDLHSEEMLP